MRGRQFLETFALRFGRWIIPVTLPLSESGRSRFQTDPPHGKTGSQLESPIIRGRKGKREATKAAQIGQIQSGARGNRPAQHHIADWQRGDKASRLIGSRKKVRQFRYLTYGSVPQSKMTVS